MEQKLTKNNTRQFFTTSDDTLDFDHHASMFFSEPVKSAFIPLK
jgi:glutamate racemase